MAARRPDTLGNFAAHHCGGTLFGFFYSRVKSREDARDLCQDVLALLVDVPLRDVAEPMRYIYTTAANVLADHFKGSAQMSAVPIDERAPDQAASLQEDSMAAVALGQDLECVLRAHPSAIERYVYLRRLLDGAPYALIAAEVNVKRETAETYYSRVNATVWEFVWSKGELGK
jgi:DNA-directed RNA polymerase specialized sigma24 family protein